MNGQPMTDAQLSAALRAHLPVAPDGLRSRIGAEVRATHQVGRLRWLVGLGNADPLVRRRALLVLAAVAMLAAVSATAVGVWLESHRPKVDLTRSNDVVTPRPTVEVARSHEVDVVVLDAYERFASLGPFKLVVRDPRPGNLDYRYFFDGKTLREEYGDQVVLLSGPDFVANSQEYRGRQVWVIDAPDSHPLGRAAGALWPPPTCASGWQEVGREDVLDRPTRHVRCGTGDLWVDLVTGLPLRLGVISFGVDQAGAYAPIVQTTLEVVELQFGPQPAALFELSGETIPAATYACEDRYPCGTPAPPGPRATAEPLPASPPPAGGPTAPIDDVPALVTASLDRYVSGDPMDIILAPRPSTEQVHRWRADGLGAFRWELDQSPQDAYPAVTWIVTGQTSYESYAGPPTTWRAWRGALSRLPTAGLPVECGLGWSYLGDDLVLARPAAHIQCGFKHWWIDREWLLVTRALDLDPMLAGTPTYGLVEVVSVSFAPQPADLFAAPDPELVRNY